MPTNEAQLVDFLLLGGGLASATAAETLRAAGVEGSIAILCAETMGDVAKGIKSLKKGLAEETEYEGKPESESTVFRDNKPALKSVRQKFVQKSRTGL